MSELFLNPWSMAAGAALVSVPILIHLINRIRYRRVRWAAMEFLLKAQKRMRRKLILQQLLLLLLRVLMVLLIGLLVGRFLGFDMTGKENRTTSHLVILDDSPSMGDTSRGEEGAAADTFETAKKTLTDQIARAASEATTAQTMEVVRLSDLGTPRSFGRLNEQSIEEMRGYLASYQPSNVRVGLAAGLKKAAETLTTQPGDVGKVVHVLSDFRSVDWAEDGEAIKQAVADLTGAGVKVYLVDTAQPFRKPDDRRSPLAHDNISIVELQPSKLVVARNEAVEFTLRVRNNGTSEQKTARFSIKVNGDEHRGGRSVSIPTLPANQERAVKFELTFDRLGTDEKPLDRFSLVTATLASDEPGGIAADNVRHAVVEVRERLPILVVSQGAKEEKSHDAFYLRPVFTSVLGGFGWEDGDARTLEQRDLTRYSFVLVLNVPTLSEAAVKNLEQYCRSGGGVGFFLGEQVRAADYNAMLYRDGQGLFPAPLAEQPSRELTEDEIQTRRFRISQKKLLLRDPARRNHPALAGLYTDERGESLQGDQLLDRVFGFISIKRYWPVRRIGDWRQDRSVTELYSLPNEQAMSDYEAAIRAVADKLPVDDPQFEKYKAVLQGDKDSGRDGLRRLAVSSEPLYRLAAMLDDLLADQQGSGTQSAALLREFWANAKMADLKLEATRLRDRVKFGDPFYLAKEFGRGRVTLITTTAGEAWTDWPSERPGNASFTPVIQQMGNYLAGAGADVNHLLGTPIEIRVAAGRYKPVARQAFMTHDPALSAGGRANPDPTPVTDLMEAALTAEADNLVLKFDDTDRPGAYLFTLTNLKGSTGTSASETAEVPEYRGVAANVDATREGDLKRVSRDDVGQFAPGVPLHAADDTDWLKDLRNKQTDLSETGWLFLALLLLLLLEQWLSMRLSFHASAGELSSTAPSAAAAMHKAPTAAEVAA